MILSIDYGTKYIGLAESDQTETICMPLPHLIVPRQRSPQDIASKFVKQRKYRMILIGLPLGLQNTPTQISKKIETFGTRLSQTTGIPVEYWNESSTSQIAESRFKSSKVADKIHSEAARIILQEYLDHINLNK